MNKTNGFSSFLFISALFFLIQGLNADYHYKIDPKKGKLKRTVKSLAKKPGLTTRNLTILTNSLCTKMANTVGVEKSLEAFKKELSLILLKGKYNYETLKKHLTSNLTLMSCDGKMSNSTLLKFVILDFEGKIDFLKYLLGLGFDGMEKHVNPKYLTFSGKIKPFVDVNYKTLKEEDSLFWMINRMRDPRYGINDDTQEMFKILIFNGGLLLNQKYNINGRGEIPAVHLIFETLSDIMPDNDDDETKAKVNDIIKLLFDVGIDKGAVDFEDSDLTKFQLYKDFVESYAHFKNDGSQSVPSYLDGIDEKVFLNTKKTNLEDLKQKIENRYLKSNTTMDNLNSEILSVDIQLLKLGGK